MNPAPLQALARLLTATPESAWNLEGETAEAVADGIRLNRLEPWCFVQGWDPDRWRDAYLLNVRPAETALALGVQTVEALERSGIACIPMRGPFWGMQYAQDAAARTFSDLDVLVPPADAGRALKLLLARGFQLRPRGLPALYYRAIHLHYPLVHPASGHYCDVHWAVDHPFRAGRIDYPAIFHGATVRDFGGLRWRVPRRDHEWVLTALHTAKELLPADAAEDAALWVRAALAGRIKTLLDLGVCGFPRPGEADIEALNRVARDWRVEGMIDRVGRILDEFRAAIVPAGDAGRVAMSPDPCFGGGAGFRRRRLADIGAYVRQTGGWRAGAHLMGAGCVAAACWAVWKLGAWKERRAG